MLSKPSRLALSSAFLSAVAFTVLPALLFNRTDWYPMLYLFKWIPVFTVAAYGAAIAAFLLFWNAKTEITVIELAWIALAVFLLIFQPLFVDIRSIHEWARNWFFFAALGGAAFLLRNLPIDAVMPAVLRAVAAGGGVSTLIGFVQQSNPTGILPYIASISEQQDRFLGNVGMDSVLGIYLALAAISGAWLLLRAAFWEREKRTPLWSFFDLSLLLLNLIGLWKAASRSALLAFCVGIVVLLLSLRPEKRTIKRVAAVFFLAVAVLAGIAYLAPDVFSIGRRDMGKGFTLEGLSSANEGRHAIWEISVEMIKNAPWGGVGLGNYKWRYMDAMAAFAEKSSLAPRYTYWAHNEYLQWMAETGIVGTVLLGAILLYCVRLAVKALGAPAGVSIGWSLAVLAALGIDSLFSRPFHHTDTAFFLALALALISRSAAQPLHLRKTARLLIFLLILFPSAIGIALAAQTFPEQAFLGKFFYHRQYATLVESEKRENEAYPFLLQDAFLQMIARENYTRALLGLGDREKGLEDALRVLRKYFATQPRYEELNMMMILYQRSGRTQEGRRYFKYYPPEEREKFLNGAFDGSYMLD